MPKKNTTVYIILGLLNHEELSGYDIKKKIDYMISHFWEVGYGQIYPSLKTMEEEGLVLKQTVGSQKGPERNLYSITEAGRNALQEWLVLPEAKEYVKYEILLKLFFGSTVSVQENRNRIETFMDRHIQNLDRMKLYTDNLKQVMNEGEDHLYYYLTVLFGEEVYKAYVNWSQKALEILEEKEKQKEKQKPE